MKFNEKNAGFKVFLVRYLSFFAVVIFSLPNNWDAATSQQYKRRASSAAHEEVNLLNIFGRFVFFKILITMPSRKKQRERRTAAKIRTACLSGKTNT